MNYELIYSMANLTESESGVNDVLWISVNQYAGKKLPHGPRLKVGKNQDVTVSISRDPKIVKGTLPMHTFNKVRDFILLNKETLLLYWIMQISTKEALNNIKSI